MKKFTLILCFFFATHSAYTADKQTYNETYPLEFTWLTKKTLVQVAGKPEVFNAIESGLEDFKKKYQLSCRVETKTHNKQGLMVFQLRGDLLSGQFSQKKDLEKALISYILPE